MIKKNIQYCSLAGLGRMTALLAQGQCGFDSVVGSRASRRRWRRRLREDDGVAGLGTAWVNGVVGSGRPTLLWAQLRSRGLGDGACVVDGITGSGQGRWWHVKELNRGRERRRGGSGENSTTVGGFKEDSMMAQALGRSTTAWALRNFWPEILAA
jgi:hypothetical protein